MLKIEYEMKRFEIFEHTADVGIRGYGKSIEEAFENAAYGMFSIMYNKLKKVRPLKKLEVRCSGYDIESLFVEWLNELLSVSNIYQIVFSQFKIQELDLKKYNLRAIVKGDTFSKEFEPAIEVKAATYSNLKVEKINNNYIAQCILDV